MTNGCVDAVTTVVAMPEHPTPAPADARVVITYCTQCRWLMRAAWMAQELLTTFADELDEVALRPATGGAFRIEAGGRTIWNRKRDGGFPEIGELKRWVRDAVCPDRDLGHHDRVAQSPQQTDEPPAD